MTVTSVRAMPLNLPGTMGTGARAKSTSLSLCLVDVELDDGRIGTGMTAITKGEVVASVINDVASHALVGMEPLRHEQAWDKLYWLLTPRGQSGYASHAMATIDLALWDLKGQILDQPVCGGPWRKRRVCPAPR